MKPTPLTKLHLGAAYYPEHWPEEHWPEDIRLMQEAGMTVSRLAEFAWSTLEPEAGVFLFDWLDRAIELLAAAGLDTILGTPTAVPPAWLVTQYPDLMAVDENGRRVQFGNRCHYCVNSPEFHRAMLRIVTAMAKHFGPNPHVIGWQFDNEYNRVCYCDRCQAKFQQFLAERYGTIDKLNDHWSTAYWSQTYSAWEQIPIPIGRHNPGLRLAFKQFITNSYRRFQKLQLDALRPHLPSDVWVTHNFMGWYDGYDHFEMSEDLDFVSWDWYVGASHHDYLSTGAMHDLTRGFKQRNFWLMETQPGNVNWSSVNNALNKWEARAMAWHAVGHGADAILYWQWRSALGGQEQYHGTLVDQSGQPRPFYEEVQQIGQDFTAVSALLTGSEPQAKVALLFDYDSRWSIQWQRHHQDFDYVEHFLHYYRPLAAMNIPIDIISADAPLDGYRLVIAPALLMLNEQRAQNLIEFVKRGRYLLLTARCGMKDGHNALLPSRQPGPLAEVTGVDVEEYYALDAPVPVEGNWFEGQSHQWAERLILRGDKYTTVIARYGSSNGWLDDQIAITVNGYGRGFVYYVGAYLDDAAQTAFMNKVIETVRIRPLLETPPGVEVCQRLTSEGEPVWILINHQQQEQEVHIPWMAHEHIGNFQGAGALTLSPYGVAVLTKLE